MGLRQHRYYPILIAEKTYDSMYRYNWDANSRDFDSSKSSRVRAQLSSLMQALNSHFIGDGRKTPRGRCEPEIGRECGTLAPVFALWREIAAYWSRLACDEYGSQSYRYEFASRLNSLWGLKKI
jgi:hypothetical protein